MPPSPATDLLDISRSTIDEGVGGLARWGRQASPHHHQVAVGIIIGGTGLREINVAVQKILVCCLFTGSHQQNPKKDGQTGHQPVDVGVHHRRVLESTGKKKKREHFYIFQLNTLVVMKGTPIKLYIGGFQENCWKACFFPPRLRLLLLARAGKSVGVVGGMRQGGA